VRLAVFRAHQIERGAPVPERRGSIVRRGSDPGFERFATRLPADVVLLIDEAYVDFATRADFPDALAWVARRPGTVTIRTFSKIAGLAGLRVGYACAEPKLLAVLDRLRESFNVGIPGLVGAEAALGDQAHVARVRAWNTLERSWLAAQLALRGLRVAPSQTNFVLADFGREALPIENALVARGVVPRPMAGYGLPNCLRITVGTRVDNARLLQALDEVCVT